MERVTTSTTWMALLIVANPIVAVHLPWDKWSWDVPQGPIEHFFRRHNDMPVKSPHFVCECPPNEECKLDFKLNEEAVDLLNIRGVLNQKEVQQFKDDMEIIKEKTKSSVLERSARMRRNNDKAPSEQCCCPPQTAMMPTFVAERRFNNVLDDLAFRREEDAHVNTLPRTL
ncbi:uncharacterized protein [Choristoneura fumiferana]|uniref:uncharacterized protein n=1 Tax=Choristoneura fumiferana TaxID=7141 RepID=UPI003D15DD9F